MKIICLITVITSFLLFFFESSNIFENVLVICLAHGLLTFMRWSSLILPVIYIFQHFKKSECLKYSSIAWSAVVFGLLINNMFSTIYKSTEHLSIFIMCISSGLLNLIIYNYLDAMPKVKTKKTQDNPISKEAMCLAFLLAGLCSTCCSYQFYFVKDYLTLWWSLTLQVDKLYILLLDNSFSFVVTGCNNN